MGKNNDELFLIRENCSFNSLNFAFSSWIIKVGITVLAPIMAERTISQGQRKLEDIVKQLHDSLDKQTANLSYL